MLNKVTNKVPGTNLFSGSAPKFNELFLDLVFMDSFIV